MKCRKFDGLLTRQGWLGKTYVLTDEHGHLVEIGENPQSNEVEVVPGLAIPGFQNAHSHAFQYAMAGLAEHLRAPDDDFWSWREAMYALALEVSPEDLVAIAAMLYSEMMRNGYTSVAEFHYLHHDRDGKAYETPATMGECLIEAARRTGIALTLVPVYYRNGDFGKPASERQRRFIFEDVDAYFRLIEDTRRAASAYDRCLVGAGVHSLRAADQEEVKRIFTEVDPRSPLHIHISEQQGEVARCKEHWGKRPVEWLLDHVSVDSRCHLVHATHLTDDETLRLAKSGATVVLCPSTEGNLGDGFFPLKQYHGAGGSWAIGSDSHVGLSPMEELRWIDYGQRLRLEKRNTLCQETGEDSGDTAFCAALDGGLRSMGRKFDSWFTPGEPFDAVVLDSTHPLMGTTSEARRLATLVYASDTSVFRGVIAAGRWVVLDGRHRESGEIRTAFVRAMNRLGGRR